MYLEDSCWTEGVFLEESRSRFLCKVNIAGEVSECYVPSSCKLGKLVDLEGKEVLLRPVSKKNARTQFAVQAIKNDKEYILLNLADANRIIYVTTSGGPFGNQPQGYNYIKDLANVFYGIPNILCFKAENLDIKGVDVNSIIQKAIKEIETADI